MEADLYKENDFVWAKLGSYSPWPAIVRQPGELVPPKPSKDSVWVWVYFLGTHNYAWIEEKNVYPYIENKLKFKKKSTEAAMRELDEIIELVEKDSSYAIPFIPYQPVVAQKQTPKKPRKSKSDGLTNDRKRSFPLKEKNTPEKKRKRLSTKTDDESDSEQLDNSVESENVPEEQLNTTNIAPSDQKYGILASNAYSEGVIKKLIEAKQELFVYCRSTTLSDELQEYASLHQTFFRVCSTPEQVVKNADIIFSYMKDVDESHSIITQLLINDSLKDKSFVEMTSMSPMRSREFGELIQKKSAAYLEAMIQGSKQEACKGELIILAAGAKPLFLRCQNFFKAIGKASFLLGHTSGSASKIHLIFQMMKGVYLSGLAEGFAMADRCSIKLDAFNNIFKLTNISSEYLKQKADVMVFKKFNTPDEPLEQLQKDIALGLEVANQYKQPMPLASNANEILKQARRMGCDNQDSACIYNRTRY